MPSRRFSASSAAQLMQCPGSANLDLAIPGWTEPVRDDTKGMKAVGTELHTILADLVHQDVIYIEERTAALREWAELGWRKRRAMCDDIDKMYDWIKAEVPGTLENPLTLGRWMAQLKMFPPKLIKYVADSADYLARVYRKNNVMSYKWERLSEHQMRATWLAEGAYTTPDVALFVHQYFGDPKLIILDFKAGKIEVNPYDNDQLRFYAMTVIAEFGIEGLVEVEYHILQPDNLDGHTEPIGDLMRWVSKARAAEARIRRKDLTLRPGKSCTFCPANPHTRGDKGSPLCPAMMEMLYPSNVDEDEIFAV